MNTERNQTKRFTNTVTGNNLIVGDQIDKRLVARTFGQLGEQKQPTYPEIKYHDNVSVEVVDE